MEEEAKALTTLYATLEISEPDLRKRKIKEANELLVEAAEKGSMVSNYLLAAVCAKDNGILQPDYIKAGTYISQLPEDFSDDSAIIRLHAEDLCRIAEQSPLAAKYILKNPHLKKRLVPNYLGRIGVSHIDLAEYLIHANEFKELLDSFDLARIAVQFEQIAQEILIDINLDKKMDPYCWIWIAQAHPILAEQIFQKEGILENAEREELFELGKTIKIIAKEILSKKNLYSRFGVAELKALRQAHDVQKLSDPK